jgi:hypothetical protein
MYLPDAVSQSSCVIFSVRVVFNSALCYAELFQLVALDFVGSPERINTIQFHGLNPLSKISIVILPSGHLRNLM